MGTPADNRFYREKVTELGEDFKKHMSLVATVLLIGKLEPYPWEVERAVATAALICNEISKYKLDVNVGAVKPLPNGED